MKEASEGARLVAQKKGRAFGSKRIFSLPILLQQVEANERVHERAQTALRRAGFFYDLLDCFRSALQRIKNFIANRCSDDESSLVSEPKLQQAFRRDPLFPAILNGHIGLQMWKAKLDKSA